MPRPRWLAILALVAAILAGGSHFGARALVEWRAAALVRLAPGLDPETARHLVGDSDPAWFEYCRRVGTGALGDALQTLGQDLREGSREAFEKRRGPLERAELRLAQGYTRVFDSPATEQRIRFDLALGTAEDYAQHRAVTASWRQSVDGTRSPEDRLRVLDSRVARLYAEGNMQRAIDESALALAIELERGRRDLYRVRLDAVLAGAKRIGDYYIVCQLLGELAEVHRAAGERDAMKACLQEGVETALAHGLLEHAARLLAFQARQLAAEGHLVAAVDRFQEARTLCERPGGGIARLRLELQYAMFAASLGGWDLVGRALRQVPPLLREVPEIGRAPERLKYGIDADRLRARLAFAEGDPDRGSRIMRSLAATVPTGMRRVTLAEIDDGWSAGLEAAGRMREALEVCERGLAHCRDRHVPEHLVPLLAREARVLDALGRFDEAAAVIDSARARRAASADESPRWELEIDVLDARNQLHRGRTAEARARIERVLRTYRERLAGGEPGAWNTFDADGADALREAVHEIESFSPAAGRAFELQWRSPAGGRGPRDRATRPTAAAPDPAPMRAPLPRPGEVHLLYAFRADRLVRWIATSSGVTCDTIDYPAARCLADVREALDRLQAEPAPRGAVLGPGATRALRAIARRVLPANWPAAPGPTLRIDVSPDGPLLALPFEALPAAGPRGEQPLAQWADVAYVRGLDSLVRPAATRAVIVANPRLSPELVRRHGWTRMLSASADELRAALTRWPRAEVLSRDDATRDRVRAAWPGASVIYLATHHVRDPDAAFLGFVPLTVPPHAGAEAAFLEISDVRAMDLSACRLAVLSSCSSGAPYRLAVRPGPSFGSAFLDAGAESVVESFWDVGDDESYQFMRHLVPEWNESEGAVAALGRARRAAMATPEGASPRVWAAWSVQLAGVPARGHSNANSTTPSASRPGPSR